LSISQAFIFVPVQIRQLRADFLAEEKDMLFPLDNAKALFPYPNCLSYVDKIGEFLIIIPLHNLSQKHIIPLIIRS